MKKNHKLFLTVANHLFETVPDFRIGQMMECLRTGTNEDTFNHNDSIMLVRLFNLAFQETEQQLLIRHYELTQVKHEPHTVNHDDESYNKCQNSFKEKVLIMIPRGSNHQPDSLLSLANADVILPVCKFLYEQKTYETVRREKILDELTSESQKLNLGY